MKDKLGKDLNVKSAECVLVLTWVRFKCQNCIVGLLTPASGCFTSNHSSETNTSQGNTDYTVISTIFHYVWIFVA